MAQPKNAAELTVEKSSHTKTAAAPEAIDSSEKVTLLATPIKEGVTAIDADLRST